MKMNNEQKQFGQPWLGSALLLLGTVCCAYGEETAKKLAPVAAERPDSFFASNVAEVKTGQAGEFLKDIGVKIQRAHFRPTIVVPAGVDWNKINPAGWELDFTNLDKQVAEVSGRGQTILPIAAYALDAKGTRARSADSSRMDVHGPPRDFEEFANTWANILAHYPQIRTVELWNEPWTWGWTWAAGPADYRKMQILFCQAVHKQDPTRQIIAGSSVMYVEDNIEPYPDSWKGMLMGMTHHPYGWSTDKPSWRAGDQFRSIDFGAQVARRMGLRYYITEGATTYEDKSITKPANTGNNPANAIKTVQFYVQQALVGAFQGNMQQDISFGPDRPVVNEAFKVMTGMLEDRPIMADIWPENELLTGAIFAIPAMVNDAVRGLPRAAEIGARWTLPTAPERQNDRTVVACVWSLTGASNEALDTEGKLTIEDAGGIKAMDLFGKEIAGQGKSLIVPLGASPVWLISDSLDVVTLRQRIASARIEGITPISVYACSLTQPADAKQDVRVRLQNQMNVPVEGTVKLLLDGKEVTSASFAAPAGKLIDVPVGWPGQSASATGQYAIRLVVDSTTVDGRALKSVQKDQLIQSARFAKRTIVCDGDLKDWQGLTPVTLDSRLIKRQVDPTSFLLNPNQKPADPTAKQLTARVWTAWDEQAVYIAVEVDEDSFKCNVGEKHRATDQPRGMPGGLGHPITCGDMIQLAFGFRERVPGFGRQMDDPWAWKGQFYDTDYVYNVSATTAGPMVFRQWGADTSRRNGYETEKVPGQGFVMGSQCQIKRDETRKVTTYEITIPREELKLFDPNAGSFRFGFLLANNEGLGELTWSEAAGVFDHWRNSGSFAPTYSWQVACQTPFGIEK